MKISVLVPAYKSQFLTECVESILAQTFQDWELILVNDASPYDIDNIVEKYNDPRIRYYRNDVGYGAENVVDNWNKCLSYAKGQYCICMGDDDRLLPNCLEEYNYLILKYPHLDVYHVRTELIDENGEIIGLQEARPEWESAYSALWHQCCCHRIQFIGDFLFRTSSLKKNGGFYKLPLAIFSDNISTICVAKDTGIANTQKICFQYRVNKYTITNTGNPKILAYSIKSAYDWFLLFLSSYPQNETDKKYRDLLLNGGLRKHLYNMMQSVILRDLNCEGISAIPFWKEHFQELGIEKNVMDIMFKQTQRNCFKLRIKKLLGR
jgi:glycosyltransferase involved in cell wall biosynthesis